MAIEEDFGLLGMVSDEPDYKLCWMLNQTLGTDFQKEDDLELYHQKLGDDQVFSVFSFTDENALLIYRIVSNRAENGFFLDELKNLDYVVHIQGEISREKIGAFLQGISTIEGIRMCVPVDLTKIRNRERLLLW
jgi:hypothetical protein